MRIELRVGRYLRNCMMTGWEIVGPLISRCKSSFRYPLSSAQSGESAASCCADDGYSKALSNLRPDQGLRMLSPKLIFTCICYFDRPRAILCVKTFNRSIAQGQCLLVFNRPDPRPPTVAMRSGMLEIGKLVGDTSPRSTSSQVDGAETGAPGLARTVE